MGRIEQAPSAFGLSPANAALKRAFDLTVAIALLALLIIPIVVLTLLARRDTRQSGIFRQTRVGLYGEPFTIYKIRTMRRIEGQTTTVTVSGDPRITRLGSILRRTKLDELPQLINVLNGTMSFVGPRPDVADVYSGLDRNSLRVLSVRPGVTGPSSLAYRDEEKLLASVADPERYNAEILFPEKIRINLDYIDNYSLKTDIRIMIRTILG